MTAPAGRRTRLATLTAFAAALLVGCVSLPTSGPVSRGETGVADELDPIYLIIDGPVAGASPEQIVRGFVTAQAAGAVDRFETARMFLTPAAVDAWDPRTGITVFAGDLAFDAPYAPSPAGTAQDETGDAGSASGAGAEGAVVPGAAASSTPGDAPSEPAGEAPLDLTTASHLAITGHARVAASVDGTGRLTEGDPEAVQDVQVELERTVEGEWRISAVPDGLLVSQPNFRAAYESTSVYFATTDLAFLVPEVRWFPRENHASYAVASLVAGPSPLLRDVVVTGAPAGTTLSVEGVRPGLAGRVDVDLSQQVLAADARQRSLLAAQIDATLRPLGIAGVDLLVGGVPLTGATPLTIERDPSPGGSPVALRTEDSAVVRLEGRELVAFEGVAPLTGRDVTGLAVSADGRTLVARLGTQQIVRLSADGSAPVPILQGTELIVPSVDRTARVWTADGATPAALTVLTPGREEPTLLEAPWLEDNKVVALRVSRDGARVALVVGGPTTSRIFVSGIVRAPDGTPTGLTTPVSGGASLTTVTDVDWVDESTLVVLGAPMGAAHLAAFVVPIGGTSEAMSTVDDVVALTAGRGRRAVYVETSTGEVFGRGATGTNWSPVVLGVRFLTYPG
ncbi:LpqB family beta-propeller domain-containing protein [Sanguibacter sp. A247]|uniref:LpqB family beta-propeller domain-containing protein n=1 Tax=unclassified Sanguibacter TaxID=2645534 RepID=UPI003FD87FCC